VKYLPLVWTALFLIAGVPYALVLAAIGGALEFLPVVGPVAVWVVVRQINSDLSAVRKRASSARRRCTK